MNIPPMTREYDAWADTAFGWWLLESVLVDEAIPEDRRLDLLNAPLLSEWAIFDHVITPGLQN